MANWFIIKSIKCSNNSEKNAPHSFPEPKVTSLNWTKQSETQRLFIAEQRRQRKTTNLYVRGSWHQQMFEQWLKQLTCLQNVQQLIFFWSTNQLIIAAPKQHPVTSYTLMLHLSIHYLYLTSVCRVKRRLYKKYKVKRKLRLCIFPSQSPHVRYAKLVDFQINWCLNATSQPTCVILLIYLLGYSMWL